jgi:hemerythrin
MPHRMKTGGGQAIRTEPESQDSASMFEFTPDMSVGITAIDADHMAFFELAKLISEIPNDENRTSIALSSLAILNEYIDGHFLREEKAMRKVKYPYIGGHCLKHNQFKARVRAIGEVFREGTLSAVDDLHMLVVRWLRDHIAVEDNRYKNWLNNSVVDDRPLVFLAMEAEEPNT